MSSVLKTVVSAMPGEPKVRLRHRANPPPANSVDAPTAPSPTAPAVEDTCNTEYQVGYGCPPKHSQFKKGVSGNKKGRPKGSRNAGTIARDLLDRKAVVTIDGKRKKVTTLEVALLQQVKKMTEKADLKALQFLTSLATPSPPAVGSPDSASTPVSVDPVDLQILAYHRREQLLAKGLDEQLVDQLLEELGLGRLTAGVAS